MTGLFAGAGAGRQVASIGLVRLNVFTVFAGITRIKLFLVLWRGLQNELSHK